MSIADGFKFWIGKQLAELAFPLAIFALIAVAYVLWGLLQVAKAKLARFRAQQESETSK